MYTWILRYYFVYALLPAETVPAIMCPSDMLFPSNKPYKSLEVQDILMNIKRVISLVLEYKQNWIATLGTSKIFKEKLGRFGILKGPEPLSLSLSGTIPDHLRSRRNTRRPLSFMLGDKFKSSVSKWRFWNSVLVYRWLNITTIYFSLPHRILIMLSSTSWLSKTNFFFIYS